MSIPDAPSPLVHPFPALSRLWRHTTLRNIGQGGFSTSGRWRSEGCDSTTVGTTGLGLQLRPSGCKSAMWVEKPPREVSGQGGGNERWQNKVLRI